MDRRDFKAKEEGNSDTLRPIAIELIGEDKMELNYFHADSLAKFSVKYVTPTYLYKSLLPLIEEAGSTEQNHGGMLGRRLSEGDITPSWGDFCILLGLAFVMWIFMKILFYIAGYWQRKAIARMQKALEIRNNNPGKCTASITQSYDCNILMLAFYRALIIISFTYLNNFYLQYYIDISY